MGVRNDARVRIFPLKHDTLFFTGRVDAIEKAGILYAELRSIGQSVPKGDS
tara:strand:- start:10883 stop:11035 length:153 start_codon:yes stop_codon:yes gene_type:complete